MVDHKQIYSQHGDMYETFIRQEDYEGNLIPAIELIQPLSDAVVVEFGAGTGRLTRQIAPLAKQVYAFDLHDSMLSEGVRVLTEQRIPRWTASLADSRAMPIPSNTADLSIEGWAFLQIATWNPKNWREESERALREMQRVTKSGGNMILIETLGSGKTEPAAPFELAQTYYDFLENEWGFSSTWIRTDYRFESMAQAHKLIGFFFGEDALNWPFIEQDGKVIVPECTGFWWRGV